MIFNMQSGGMIPDDILDAQTITPGTSNKVIAAGTYLRGAQTILGDADLIPGNIKEGVNIFGVEGTHKEVQATLPLWYSYTGSSTLETTETENGKEWKLKLLTSGTLTIFYSKCPIVDAFLVGGGGGGSVPSGVRCIGGGGGGGYTLTQKNLSLQTEKDYVAIIGAGGSNVTDTGSGGSGGATSIAGLTALGGNGGGIGSLGELYYGVGGSGGSGGGGGYPYSSSDTYGSGQGTTTREFGESEGALYAGGGGGGYYPYSKDKTYRCGGAGGSDGSNGKNSKSSSSPYTSGTDYIKGGDGGGGNGALYFDNPSNDATSGAINTGGGGGGGSCVSKSSGSSHASGAGGSGIIILRGRYA